MHCKFKNYAHFNAEGETSTIGLCNVTIPVTLLGGPYTVKVDNNTILEDYNPTTNGTHAFIYFTYNHSPHKVEIIGTTVIAEFPLSIIMPIFMMTTLLAIVYGRRYPTKLLQLRK